MRAVTVGERARVPFAVVAVVLLVGSATLAVSIRGRAPGGADPDTEAAIDRTVSASRTAIATATERASRAAARDPVLTPANTTYGRLLSDDRPFRDSLELRVYLAVRRALATTDQRVREVRATASLPPVRNVSAAEAALERVSVRGEGRTLTVMVRNVTIRATRDGQTVVTERRTFTVGVHTPVLAVHSRVERFERRLNRGALAGPGLGRRLTARLYAVVWARGYAQYGGAPIGNVLANRHVELMANGALLDAQAAAFGRADPSGETALLRAAAEVGIADLLSAAGASPDWADHVLGVAPEPPGGAAPPDPDPHTPVGEAGISATNTTAVAATAPSPTDNATVAVGRTADRAFVDLLRGEGGWNRSLSRAVNRTYAARAKLVTAVDGPRGDLPAPESPGDGWELRTKRRSVDRTVLSGDGPRPAVS